MDIAERNGVVLRRVLRSAERFNERAICPGVPVKTPGSKSSALLCCVTACDQREPRAVEGEVAISSTGREGPVHRWGWGCEVVALGPFTTPAVRSGGRRGASLLNLGASPLHFGA